MRRLVLTAISLAVVAGIAFGVSPLFAAWSLRQALDRGDAVEVAQRVEFTRLRTALRGEQAELERLVAEMAPEEDVTRKGLWDRIKSAAAPLVLGNAVDRAVTPGGLVRIYAMRRAWQDRVRPRLRLVEPETLLSGTPLADSSLDKGLSAMRRLERAAFVAPTRFELEVRDRYDASRRFRATLELIGYSWKLTSVRVLREDAPAAAQPAPAS